MSRWKNNTFDVFVGNLPGYVDKGYVEHMFKHCGEIAAVFLRPSKFNKSKIAYVKFFCEPDAIKAVEKYKHLSLDGNSLEVKLLPPKNENYSSFGKNSYVSTHTNGAASGNSVFNSSPTTSGLASTVFNQKHGGEELTIAVCHVESPVAFYGQRVSNLVEVVTIGNKLQTLCSSFMPLEGFPHINQIYAARFSQDQLWYRCRVIHTEKNRSFVCYIDYGNEEYVNNKDIVILPDDLAKIPPQSSLFVFKDLKPVASDENKEIYDKAIAYMKKLTDQTVQLHTVFCTENFFVIDKCVFQNIDLYDILQKERYAMKVPSSSARSGASQKNLKSSANNEKNEDLLSTSKGTPPQSSSHKANSRSPKSPSSKFDHTLKVAATFKKPPTKHSGKDVCDELEKLKLQNNKLTKELTLEKERSKALKQELEALKAKAVANHFEKLDSVILKTQQLFLMRNQHLSSEGGSSLEEVYDAIKAKLPFSMQTPDENADQHEKVENALLHYQELSEKVESCEKSDLLSDHIRSRDEACKTACDLMKEYLRTWNGDYLTERVVYLKKLLLEMKIIYEKYLMVDVNSNDKSLEELIGEYKENKMKVKTSSESLVKNTNDALNRFSSVIDNLQKDITIPSDGTKDVTGICIRFATAAFIDCIREVQEAVNAEVIAKSAEPKSPISESLMAALVKVLVKEIETPLEATLQEIKDCKKYNILYPELCSYLNEKPVTTRIYEIRKEVKKLKSKLRHKLADKKDIEESDDGSSTSVLNEINSSLDMLLHELHACFKEEHDEMMKIVNAYKTHFRELDIENPDLNLSAYSKCNGILKESWEMEHFNYCSVTKRPGMCYSAKFCEDSVIIKEFHLNCDEYDQFLKKIITWSTIKDDNVVPIHAVFKSKVGFQTYGVFPHFTTLEELEEEFPFNQSDAGQILCGVLKGLECIHSRGLSHSLLNPSTVLITSGTHSPISLLDFSFGLSHTTAMWESKGIKFHPPEKELCQASDLYNFGCLILWMLFPNLQFTCTSDGGVDIAGYKSIMQNLLSNSCYEAVESLLSAEPSTRPTAKSLLEKDIFMELMCNSSNDDPSHASTPVSQNSEISMVVSATSEETSDITSASDR